jgi:hypothetical protein
MKDFFARLLTFEPTMVRAVLVALAVAVGAFGLDISDVTGRVDVAWTALFGIVPILQGLLTRPAVTPNASAVDAYSQRQTGDDPHEW